MTPLKARILLADDHALVRHALRIVLDGQPDLEVIAEAGDGIEAVRGGLDEDIDLAILDIARRAQRLSHPGPGCPSASR